MARNFKTLWFEPTIKYIKIAETLLYLFFHTFWDIFDTFHEIWKFQKFCNHVPLCSDKSRTLKVALIPGGLKVLKNGLDGMDAGSWSKVWRPRLLPVIVGGKLENGSIFTSSLSPSSLTFIVNREHTWCFTRPNKGRQCLTMVILWGKTLVEKLYSRFPLR